MGGWGYSALPATFRKDTPVQAEIDCQQSHQDDEEDGENTNYHDLYCIQKCSEIIRVIFLLSLRLFQSAFTCTATLSHLPPLDNSLIPSWSPPWFLWSWQPHKLDRDRLRSWVISGAELQYFSLPPLSSWKVWDWNLVSFHFWESRRQMTNVRLMGSRQTWKLTKFVKFLVWELSEAASYHFNPSNLSVDCKYVDDLRS